MKQNTPAQKSWTRMTAEELAEATREFDHPLPPERFRKLTKAERQEFERDRRAALRREKTRGTNPVVVHLDANLAKKSGDYAAKHHMSLSALVNKSLKSMLAFVE